MGSSSSNASGGSGGSSFSFQGPSFKSWADWNTGSATYTSNDGSKSMDVKGPDAFMGGNSGNMGRESNVGSATGTVWMNENRAFSVGAGKGVGGSQRTSSDGATTTQFNMPFSFLSFGTTYHPTGNPKMVQHRQQQDQLHTDKLLLESKLAERESIRSTQSMLPPSTYQQQMHNSNQEIQRLQTSIAYNPQNK